MRQRAQVIKVENGKVWVKAANPAATCGKCNGCIRLTPQAANHDQETILELDNTLGVTEGDWVIMEMPTNQLMRALLILYGIPLLGLLLGYVLAFWLVQADDLAGLGAFGGLVVAVLIARIWVKRLEPKFRKPVIVAQAC